MYGKKDIIKLLEKSNVAKDLKVAYSFMLLSRGYTADEIKVLDDYVFSIRKKKLENLLILIKLRALSHEEKAKKFA